MRFEGSLKRSGRLWLAEVPAFDAMTQGRTRVEALEMVSDLLVSLSGDPRLTVRVTSLGSRAFEVEGTPVSAMTALLLRRQREASGLSLAEVARRLGQRSRTAYARYERGAVVPSVERLEALLRAVAPEGYLVWRPGGDGRHASTSGPGKGGGGGISKPG